MGRLAPGCKHGTDSISNCEVPTLNRTILIGGICASESDGISKFMKERANEGVAIKFAALIEHAVFVRACGRMFGEKIAQPGNWGGFGDLRVTVFHAREVIGDEYPASFTIKAIIKFWARSVLVDLTPAKEKSIERPWNGTVAVRVV